jgi:aquaporin Z
MKNYITEFIGTFFMVLVIGLSINDSQIAPMAPVAVGGILMAMIYMGGPISGAHYNPAITLAIWIRKKIETRDVVPYMLSQIMGGLCAALIYYFIFKVSMGAPAPRDGFTYNIKPLLAEALFTFALASVVLNVATSKKSANNSYYGLAIGLTVMAAAYSSGNISGGVLNPAVGIGTIIIHTMLGGGDISNLWLYIVGPCLGGFAASLVYRLMNRDEFN